MIKDGQSKKLRLALSTHPFLGPHTKKCVYDHNGEIPQSLQFIKVASTYGGSIPLLAPLLLLLFKTIRVLSLHCVMTPGLSKDIWCHIQPYSVFAMLANHQIRHLATHDFGCQPGDCSWPVNLPEKFVWVPTG